jgi:hypothetical protein
LVVDIAAGLDIRLATDEAVEGVDPLTSSREAIGSF